MKKFYVAFCAFALTLGVEAQDVSGDTYKVIPSNEEQYSVESVPGDTYNGETTRERLIKGDYLQYIGLQYNSVDFGDDLTMNGLSIGYGSWGEFGTSRVLLNYELFFQYAFKEKDDFKYTTTGMGWKFNVGYGVEVSPSFVLIPYAGFNIRQYFSGKCKNDDWDIEYDMFESTDDGGLGCRSLLWGWQVGLRGIVSNRLLLGVSYASDFKDIIKDGKHKLSALSVTLGIMF